MINDVPLFLPSNKLTTWCQIQDEKNQVLTTNVWLDQVSDLLLYQVCERTTTQSQKRNRVNS